MEIEYKYKHLPHLNKLPLRQHIVVLSGAGMSAESGLYTYILRPILLGGICNVRLISIL